MIKLTRVQEDILIDSINYIVQDGERVPLHIETDTMRRQNICIQAYCRETGTSREKLELVEYPFLRNAIASKAFVFSPVILKQENIDKLAEVLLGYGCPKRFAVQVE